MLMFGGERTDIDAPVAQLSADVYAAQLTPTTGVFAKLPVSDAFGSECSYSVAAPETSTCPVPRRDASIAMTDNKGVSNGRLIVFGGVTGIGASFESPAMRYLRRSPNAGVKPLNDLWYLDLSGLTEACLLEGACATVIPWRFIEVPGERPLARWGAAMTIDESGMLFVTGGASYNSDSGYTELDELFVFRLRDAFYKKCSATGEGLRSAIAGVPANFYVQCQDTFGDPAQSASLRVEIAGPVSMLPTPIQVAPGKFLVTYTPIRAGSGVSNGYKIYIYVGRGSEDFQELIAGVDPSPYDNVHDPYTVTESPVPWDLSVAPGGTSPSVSKASGEALTLSSAGTVGSFTLTAQDAFGNRRPGGDAISVSPIAPPA